MNVKKMMNNTWPDGKRHAMYMDEHEKWNAMNYPGTRQICCKCDEPTGYCDEDGTFDDDGKPYCTPCAIGAGLIEGDIGN